MKVNPISPAFKGVVHNTLTSPKSFFGAKEDTYDIVSDAKDLNIWVITHSNKDKPMLHSVLIQNKEDDKLLKTFACGHIGGGKAKGLREINQYLQHYKEPLNLSISQKLLDNKDKSHDPKFAEKFSEFLINPNLSKDINN